MLELPPFVVYDGATAGGGKDPTVAYTESSGLGTQYPCAEFNSLGLDFDLVAGTPPDVIEYLLETSMQPISIASGASRWKNKALVTLAAGVMTWAETNRRIIWPLALSGVDGHATDETINAEKFRVRVRRIGGGVDTRIVVTAKLAGK